MPPRTNAFQNTVALVTALMREDDSVTATPSAMVTDRATGRPREVDILVETEAAGHKVSVGIECRAWKRPQTVEWVEAMWGKHNHLSTDALVLVSASGFRPAALELADFYGIKAITPGEATPEFVGRVVNNLTSVWAKIAHFTPDRVHITVQWPDGETQVVDASNDMNLHLPDGTALCTVQEYVRFVMSQGDLMKNECFRDATGEEKFFELGLESPIAAEDQPICMQPYIDGQPEPLVPVTRMVIIGPIRLQVVEVPLAHGNYDGTDFSAGRGSLGDATIDVAVTESASGLRWAMVQSLRGEASGT